MKPLFELPALLDLTGSAVLEVPAEPNSGNNDCGSGSGDDNGCRTGSGSYPKGGNGCSGGSKP